MCPALTFGVYGFRANRTERVATFFTFGDAADFVAANLPTRNFYMAEPDYDRRKAGYRPGEALTMEMAA